MIAQVRERSPAVYLRVVAGLVPQQVGITDIREEVRTMMDEELNKRLVKAAMVLGWQLVPPPDGEPVLLGPD